MGELDKILVVVAHPDDEILGTGGLFSHFKDSCDVRIVFLAEGSSARFSDRKRSSNEIAAAIREREQSALEAASLFNIKSLFFNQLVCGSLNSIPLIDINHLVQHHIETFKPTKIFTHYQFDNHEDHRIVFRSVMSVARPLANSSVKDIYSIEIPSSTNFTSDPIFSPNVFLEITENDLSNKIKALECYKSEIRPYPFPRSREALIATAKFRGMQIGKHFAEAYQIVRGELR
jgi:LmbE family N-acetylglucosaminyl deacetylase